MTDSKLRRLPKKTIKRILTNECGGQVSTESVEYIQSFIENLLKDICKSVVIKQEEENKLRKFHGLHPKRRFDLNLFISVSEDGLNSSYEFEMSGKEAESVNPTPLSKEAGIEVQ